MSTESLQYRAFLSYSHQDSKIAARLHRKLESYRVPKALWIDSAGSVPARLQPVFRDREELASAARLSNSIEDALDASEALIVVCSPASVASRWVNEEISYFRKHHPDRPVLAFIIAGDPANDPRISSGTAAFPVNLVLADINQPDGLLGEPLAADARDEADGFSSAFLKLAAGLLNVGYDKLRQREQRRQQQRWAFIGGASLVLAAVFAYLAWQATVARDQAREAQAVAELELTSERQTRNFLLSVFQLADPGEARGNDVTVREVLDRAVKRIDATQFSRPVIRSRFLATMGQAYGSLGLTQRSAELLQQSLDDLPGTELSSESRIQRTDSQIGLADVLFDMGDYDRALAILDSAIDAAGDAEAHSPLQQALLANIRGDILSYQERDDAAMAEYQKAMAIVDVTALNVEEDVSVRSRSIGGIAQLKYFAGETLVAEQLYTQAADLLIPVFGEDHPDTIWALSSQASIAYINGNVELARQSWTRLLDISLRVYDENSSAIATLKNSLGLLLMQTGEFDEAEELLRAAIAIDKTQRSENFDDLTYPLSNLALVRISLGDRREAENLLLEAEEIAAAANHRWLGMVLNNLADLSCMDRSVDKGLEYSGRALPVATAEFGEADWRVERVAMTRAYCQAMAGSNIDSEQLERSLAVIIDRWGAANLYSQRAIMQLRDIHSELGQAAEATGLAARLESWMEGWEPQSISNTASPF